MCSCPPFLTPSTFLFLVLYLAFLNLYALGGGSSWLESKRGKLKGYSIKREREREKRHYSSTARGSDLCPNSVRTLAEEKLFRSEARSAASREGIAYLTSGWFVSLEFCIRSGNTRRKGRNHFLFFSLLFSSSYIAACYICIHSFLCASFFCDLRPLRIFPRGAQQGSNELRVLA